MNEELKEMGKQLKEILDKYPHRQKEILFYIFGEDTIRKIANKHTYKELEEKVNKLESELSKSKLIIYETIQYLKKYIKDLIDTPLGHRTFRQYMTPCKGALEILERGKSDE